MAEQRLVLDTNVFVTAKRTYYPFHLVPGYWDCLEHFGKIKRIHSIDRVRDEIESFQESDELNKWIERVDEYGFFRTTQEKDVVGAYAAIMGRVNQNADYAPDQKSKFASGADGWLVGHALIHDSIVVTNELPASGKISKVKIPDICGEFGVQCLNTYEMLEMLGARFTFSP